MTMARIKDDKVVAVGLPNSLESTKPERLYALGWRQVKGTPKPTDGSGYEYTHPYTYNADEDAVYGTWQQTDVLDRILETQKNEVRKKRNELLEESDFSVLSDVPMTNAQEWETYRQALRDITELPNFPRLSEEDDWPTRPITT